MLVSISLLDSCHLDQQREVLAFQHVATPDRPVFVAVLGQQLASVQSERCRVGAELVGRMGNVRGAFEGLDVHPQAAGACEDDRIPLQLNEGRPG